MNSISNWICCTNSSLTQATTENSTQNSSPKKTKPLVSQAEVFTFQEARQRTISYATSSSSSSNRIVRAASEDSLLKKPKPSLTQAEVFTFQEARQRTISYPTSSSSLSSRIVRAASEDSLLNNSSPKKPKPSLAQAEIFTFQRSNQQIISSRTPSTISDASSRFAPYKASPSELIQTLQYMHGLCRSSTENSLENPQPRNSETLKNQP